MDAYPSFIPRNFEGKSMPTIPTRQISSSLHSTIRRLIGSLFCPDASDLAESFLSKKQNSISGVKVVLKNGGLVVPPIGGTVGEEGVKFGGHIGGRELQTHLVIKHRARLPIFPSHSQMGASLVWQ